ncbi:MAG TPA: hypothetical protein PLU94_09150 [Methanoregulaceae archaeon]|nr:hypothetical protein [Methanoregulaceae archaeon]
MTLKENELKKIARDLLVKDSPELADVEPIVSEDERSVPKAVERKLGIAPKKAAVKKVKVFTYKKVFTAEDGAKIPVIARITIDENGNIIKFTGN